MPQKDTIVADAILEIGHTYYWNSFMQAGGIPGWLGGDPVNKIGTTADTAISCFDLPLLLAIRRGYASKAMVQNIYGSIMDSHIEQGFASKTAWKGLGWLLSNWTWNDWPNPFGTSTTLWRPRSGDLVFLNEPGGGNHVVLSLGPNGASEIEVVSFGEGLTKAGATTVNRLTVTQLRNTYATVNRVSFVDPVWS